MSFEKLGDAHRADFLFSFLDTPFMYVEIKNRTCTSGQYRTYIISKDKLLALSELAASDGLNAVLIVQWRDQVGYIEVSQYLANATFRQGGRYDRGDQADIEEMAEVAINLFSFF